MRFFLLFLTFVFNPRFWCLLIDVICATFSHYSSPIDSITHFFFPFSIIFNQTEKVPPTINCFWAVKTKFAPAFVCSSAQTNSLWRNPEPSRQHPFIYMTNQFELKLTYIWPQLLTTIEMRASPKTKKKTLKYLSFGRLSFVFIEFLNGSNIF